MWHRAVVPTTSAGLVPISAALPIRRRVPMPRRPKVRLPIAAQKMRRRTRTKPRQQSRVRPQIVRHSLHLRPTPLDRIATSTKLIARLCRSAPQLRIGDRVCWTRKTSVATQAAGVECETIQVEHEHPYQAIIDTADAKGCDLIVMASHGRHGISAIVLGSETVKVLRHCKIPVLVHR